MRNYPSDRRFDDLLASLQELDDGLDEQDDYEEHYRTLFRNIHPEHLRVLRHQISRFSRDYHEGRKPTVPPLLRRATWLVTLHYLKAAGNLTGEPEPLVISYDEGEKLISGYDWEREYLVNPVNANNPRPPRSSLIRTK